MATCLRASAGPTRVHSATAKPYRIKVGAVKKVATKWRISSPYSSIFHTHTKSTFIPLQLPPTLLTLLASSFFSPLLSQALHLRFIYTSSSPASPLFLPLSLFPCHSIFFFVHSPFTPCCYSSRPPSSCSPGVCGSDNEAP